MGGIPLPSRGIVGKNRSKTTVRSKRVGPLGSNGAPLLGSHSDFEDFYSWSPIKWWVIRQVTRDDYIWFVLSCWHNNVTGQITVCYSVTELCLYNLVRPWLSSRVSQPSPKYQAAFADFIVVLFNLSIRGLKKSKNIIKYRQRCDYNIPQIQ